MLPSLLAVIKFFLNRLMYLYLFSPGEGAIQHYVTSEEPDGFDGWFHGPNGFRYAQDDGEHRYVAHKHISNLLFPREN
jgi:hypothetical protein